MNWTLWIILAVPLYIFNKINTQKDFHIAEQMLKVFYI